MDDFRAIYGGKRVLITGDTGFKGSWLALWLRELGAEVTGFALPPEGERNHFTLTGLGQSIRHVDGDIRGLDALAGAMRDAEPEFVFHLAAQALVRRSYDEPKLTFDTNVGGSVNVLEAIRHTPSVRSAVYITSDKCYRNREWPWGYRESDELGGHDPYSASKAAAEAVFAGYRASFFSDRGDLGIASTRAGNVIGGGDWAPERIVPDCMRALGDNAPIVLRNPRATRPWQHVLEPLGGYLLLGARLRRDADAFAGSWNFGPPVTSAWTVGRLAECIVKYWGSGEIVIREDEAAPHESTFLHLNIDKAELELGWTPRWHGETAIRETVAWYKAVNDGTPPLEATLGQIRKYMDGKDD